MSFHKIINTNKPMLVDFHAVWCGPCKTMNPILKDLKAKVGDTAGIVKVDVDLNKKLAAKYQVKSVPTLILFKNGKAVWRKSGVVSSNVIQKAINQYA